MRQFRFPEDQHRYTAARGWLRFLLGRYLDLPPQEIAFSYSSHGKPHLQEVPAQSGIQFNLAHACEYGLFAFTRDRRIGVDLEGLRPKISCAEIAERFFGPGEKAAWGALPESERPAAFYRCWTRKEAFLKACGLGLSLPAERCDLPLHAGPSHLELSSEDNPLVTGSWIVCDLELPPGYHGALVVEGTGWELKCWAVPAEPAFL